jgi:hypothetical protein
MGVYVLITSVYPPRIYVFEDVMVRFCKKPYTTASADDRDQYVVNRCAHARTHRVRSRTSSADLACCAPPAVEQFWKFDESRHMYDGR